MIAVIADDFTGAAEIGGVGLRYGLKVLIETEVNEVSDVDLLVIATDTRSLSAEEASHEVAVITDQLMKLAPRMIFKKIDSVLRGHVARELEAQMLLMKKSRTLIVAANPSVGRTIVDGRYLVGKQPLNETSFADDPDFPVATDIVTEIVHSENNPVCSVKLHENLPVSGLLIADVCSHEELSRWATCITDEMVIAGGSGFFAAVLENVFKYIPKETHSELAFGESTLFVFGSKFPKRESMLEKFYTNKVVRINMPREIYYNEDTCDDCLSAWAVQVADQLKSGVSVMVTIDHEPIAEDGLSLRLRQGMGQLVANVEKYVDLKDLFIEGGATTSVVLKCLHVNKLYPFNEADFGVIQMHADGRSELRVTTKPGSYLWPDHLVFKQKT